MPTVTRGFIHESLSGPQREFFPQSHFVFFQWNFYNQQFQGTTVVLYSKFTKKNPINHKNKEIMFFWHFFFRISVAASTNFDFFGGFFFTTPSPALCRRSSYRHFAEETGYWTRSLRPWCFTHGERRRPLEGEEVVFELVKLSFFLGGGFKYFLFSTLFGEDF